MPDMPGPPGLVTITPSLCAPVAGSRATATCAMADSARFQSSGTLRMAHCIPAAPLAAAHGDHSDSAADWSDPPAQAAAQQVPAATDRTVAATPNQRRQVVLRGPARRRRKTHRGRELPGTAVPAAYGWPVPCSRAQSMPAPSMPPLIAIDAPPAPRPPSLLLPPPVAAIA